MVKPSTKYKVSGRFLLFRYWIAKLIYDVSFVILVHDGSWRHFARASLSRSDVHRIGPKFQGC